MPPTRKIQTRGNAAFGHETKWPPLLLWQKIEAPSAILGFFGPPLAFCAKIRRVKLTFDLCGGGVIRGLEPASHLRTALTMV
jgi:hypothetical protein